MRRTLAVLLRAAIAAVLLAACGGGGSAPAGAGDSGATDAAGGTDTATAGDGAAGGRGDGAMAGSDSAGGSLDGGTTDAAADDAPTTAVDAGSGCGTTATTGMHDETITAGGMARTFHLYVPAKYDAKTPDTLVFVYHGLTETGTGSTPLAIEYLSQMDPVSDAQGFLLVYPDGYQNSWNAGRC
ncbi:MAG TPA: hypothetical protein VIY73_29365, partial [Polyangiaceae bacterium]